MNNSCGCGGRLRSWSNNPLYFVFKCDKCGRKIKQRKRQPAIKNKELFVVKLYGSKGEVLIDKQWHVTDLEEVQAAMDEVDAQLNEMDEGKLPR